MAGHLRYVQRFCLIVGHMDCLIERFWVRCNGSTSSYKLSYILPYFCVGQPVLFFLEKFSFVLASSGSVDLKHRFAIQLGLLWSVAGLEANLMWNIWKLNSDRTQILYFTALPIV